MMEFVEEEEVDLPIMDVAKKLGRRSYPVPTEAVESLPLHILGTAQKQGYVRLQAEYVIDDKTFYHPSIGWTSDQRSPWDKIMEEIDQQDAVTPVLDYMVHKHGDESWTPEAIADVRDVEPDTVRENINRLQANGDEAED